MKSVFFLFTIITSVTFAQAPDYFARKETVTTSVLGQTSYTKYLDITEKGQIRLTVSETGKTQTPLDVKYYGTLDPRILGKLKTAVANLPLETDPNYSYKPVGVSGHESAFTYVVLSRMGYVVVMTKHGPERVHPQAKTLSSAPFVIRDLLDSFDALTEPTTYENPKVGPYCVSKNFDGTQAYVSGYIKSGTELDYILQNPGCAALRVVAGAGYKLETYTLESTVPAPFDKVKSYGYGVSLTGTFNDATGVFTATRATTTTRVD